MRKDRQYRGKKSEKKTKKTPTMVVKILHGRLDIKQDE